MIHNETQISMEGAILVGWLLNNGPKAQAEYPANMKRSEGGMERQIILALVVARAVRSLDGEEQKMKGLGEGGGRGCSDGGHSLPLEARVRQRPLAAHVKAPPGSKRVANLQSHAGGMQEG